MMSLEQEIMEKIKDAMRQKDEAALRTLRAIKAAILLEKTSATAKDEISKEDEIKLLQKMAKQRKDALEIFTQQKRDDLADKEKEELSIIETFLPQPIGIEELKSILNNIIVESGATGVKDLGKVMAVASKILSGRAEGKLISETAKSLLQA